MRFRDDVYLGARNRQITLLWITQLFSLCYALMFRLYLSLYLFLKCESLSPFGSRTLSWHFIAHKSFYSHVKSHFTTAADSLPLGLQGYRWLYPLATNLPFRICLVAALLWALMHLTNDPVSPVPQLRVIGMFNSKTSASLNRMPLKSKALPTLNARHCIAKMRLPWLPNSCTSWDWLSAACG